MLFFSCGSSSSSIRLLRMDKTGLKRTKEGENKSDNILSDKEDWNERLFLCTRTSYRTRVIKLCFVRLWSSRCLIACRCHEGAFLVAVISVKNEKLEYWEEHAIEKNAGCTRESVAEETEGQTKAKVIEPASAELLQNAGRAPLEQRPLDKNTVEGIEP